MPLNPEIVKPAFIICPNCGGEGKLRTLSCAQCSSIGTGAFQSDRFLYFNFSLSKTLISLETFKKWVDRLFQWGAAGLGLLGIASLGFWLDAHGHIIEAAVTMSSVALKNLQFWRFQHPLILGFWLSLIPDMYLLYRVSRRRDQQPNIVKILYGENTALLNAGGWDEVKKIKFGKKINVIKGANEDLKKTLERAFLLAGNFKHSRIEPLHLFAGALFSSRSVMALASRLTIPDKKLIEGIERQLNEIASEGGEPVFSGEAKQILIEAYANAAASGRSSMSSLDILLPTVKRNEKLGELLYDLEVDITKLSNAIAWFQVNDQLVENYHRYKRLARFKPSSNMDRAYTALATPLLDHFSYDLTLAAKWGRLDLCVGREAEIRRLFDAVESGRMGAVLVGPLGTGKGTIMGGLAQRMVLEEVPERLQDKRLIELDVARLIGGSAASEAEEKMLAVINEVARARNIILYIRDIEKIMGISAGEEGSLDLAGVLADAISRGIIYCFASATDENYAKYVEKTPLGSALQLIEVKEPDTNEAILMVESKIGGIEGHYGVYFSYNALAEVVNLSARYIHDKYLPAKAVQILESVAVTVSRRENKVVDREAIAAVITEVTHIPVTKLTDNESKSLLNLEERIHERMIGQSEAVTMVAASLRRARVELRESKRPIANFLFLGPTGVGKTELAKTVAEVYFGREDYMIRLDMSEYQNEDSVNKMIGSPEGLLGYLTEAVRKMPFSLILLDEIEKAHPDILNLFLQVMDDGRLTDGQGRTIDFTNSILIATSNVGSALIQEKVREGISLDTLKQQLIDQELVKAMRPELINRFDGVIIFKPLDEEAVVAIARLMLKKIQKMVEGKGYAFSISDAAVAALAKLGFQPEFGARPLRRLLQERVEDAIATKILEGDLKRRDTISINDDLSIAVTKAPEL